ncbi:unnamed protein product [Mycena citricolor]|uniref:Uncharacterized protein n=1 Tax=Mycena citricolor TaxID=2018698 RepID=A0AAD2H8C9_9AGAR|nr:unnamed protein product [Mycena citricolor]
MSSHSPIFGLYCLPSGASAACTPVSFPLLSVRISARLTDLSAQVTLVQTYLNATAPGVPTSTEARYAFPVPARAVVHSFTMIRGDGTRVVGRVQEKRAARKTYDSAVQRGKQAGILEQSTPDVFRVSVGNIPPNEEVQIELVYATELTEDEENDSVRFHVPMHIGARYGVAPAELGGFESQNVRSHGAFLEMITHIESTSPISEIGSPSHTISTELGPDPALPNASQLPFSHYARVFLSSDAQLQKDFVLTVKSAGLDTPRCVAETREGEVAMGLTFVPRFVLPPVARQEYIFLVDRSGSMDGQRMMAARKALVVMLRSLPHRDSSSLFNIASFGSDCTLLWPQGSRAYDQETLEQATEHVDSMWATYGGTEIRYALGKCFAQRQSDRPTSIFMLTDGDAWDLAGVLELVKGTVDKHPVRVFVLGIGDAVSTAMCEGIARVGNGACMFVGESETKFTGKVARLLKAAKTPVIGDVHVDWGSTVVSDEAEEEFELLECPPAPQTKRSAKLNLFDCDVDVLESDDSPAPPPSLEINLPPIPSAQQSPFKIRSLLPGVRCTVYAILQSSQIPPKVVLHGTTADGATIELPVDVTASCLGTIALHAISARKIIQDLEDGQHGLARDGDPDLLSRTVNAAIVRLGTKYGIASSQTSFVAVDETIESVDANEVETFEEGLNSLRTLASASASSAPSAGVHMPAPAAPPPPMLIAAPPPPPRAPPPGSVAPSSSSESDDTYGIGSDAGSHTAPPIDDAEESDDDMGFGLFDGGTPPPHVDSDSLVNSDPLEALARLQSFDGAFSAQVLDLAFMHLTVDRAGLRALLSLPAGLKDEDVLLATVLAMAYLSSQLGGDVERECWEDMYSKAHDYVCDALGWQSAQLMASQAKAVDVFG